MFRADEPVAVAGKVGVPIAELVGEIEPDATVVAETSSFQLEDTSLFSPEGAIFLNLAPDHLDRHGDLPAYRNAKLRVFANQGNDDVAVWNGDDPELAGVDLGGCARRIEFCRGASPDCEVASGRRNDLLGRRTAARDRGTRHPRRAQRRERDGGAPRRRSPSASTATRSAPACAASPASRTGWSRSPRSTASASSTTRRRPTSPPPRSASAASTAASTRSSAAATRASRSRRWSAAARARRRRLPARRHRRADGGRAGAARRGRGAAAPRRRSRGRGPHRGRRRRPWRGRPAQPRLRQLRRLPELRSARRALPPDRRRARGRGG